MRARHFVDLSRKIKTEGEHLFLLFFCHQGEAIVKQMPEIKSVKFHVKLLFCSETDLLHPEILYIEYFFNN